MMLRFDRSSEIKDSSLPWQLGPDHSAKLAPHEFIPKPNSASAVLSHPIVPNLEVPPPLAPDSHVPQPSLAPPPVPNSTSNSDHQFHSTPSNKLDTLTETTHLTNSSKLINSVDHLTPLTDVPSEDEGDREGSASGEQPADDVDEGYQSGAPSSEELTAPKDGTDEQPPSQSASGRPTNSVNSNTKSSPSVPSNAGSSGSTADASSSSPSRPTINGDEHPSRSSSPTKSPAYPAELDPKVSLLLELNAELLKIFSSFQSRGLHASAEGTTYSNRLSSNLNWLASSVDKRVESVPLPIMDCPPVAALVDGARLKQLYEKLPVVFSKDIARRPHVGIKRERTPEDVGNIATKRRDLGDSKLSSLASHVPPSLDQPVNLNGSTLVNQVAQNHPMTGLPAPGLSNLQASITPIPPGLVNPQINQVPRIAQSAPNAEYLRQVQLRNAAQRQGSQGSPPPPQLRHTASVPEPVAHIASQSQPFPGMAQPHAGMPPPPNPNPLLEILQNPSHPIMKYILGRDPMFMQRPLQNQLVAVRGLHARQLAQQQQQQAQMQMQQHQSQMAPQQAQAQQMVRIPGHPGPTLVPAQVNTMVGGNQFRPATSMGQHVPNKHQQMHPTMGPISGIPAENNMVANPMMIPLQGTSTQRPGSSGQFPGGGSNMTMQQRQQLIMMQQQQQQMRGISNAPGGSPQNFGPPQQSPQFHHSPTQAHTPGFVDGVNTSRPGSAAAAQVAARSTQSPSESIGSPAKRQMSFSGESFRPSSMMAPNMPQQQMTQTQITPQMPQLQVVPQQFQQMASLPQQGNPQVPQQIWPSNFGNAGMSPAAFQLNQNPPNIPQFINPAALSGGPMANQTMGAPVAGPQWAGNPQFTNNHAGSPTPSMHHSDSGHLSRHTSATPAPQMPPDSSQPAFDQSMYTSSWS